MSLDKSSVSTRSASSAVTILIGIAESRSG